MLKSFQRNKYTDLDRRAPGPPRVESKVHVVELEEVDKLKALGVQSFKKVRPCSRPPARPSVVEIS